MRPSRVLTTGILALSLSAPGAAQEVTRAEQISFASQDASRTPLRDRVAREGATHALLLRVLADSYHDFDHPSAPLRLRKDVPNGVRPGEGVTVGSNPAARREAYGAMLDFLAQELR